ncbi:hypothetical protein [Dyadobacter sandarakinus]|uniref:Lipoprotein n=1 Tax=Dyadobacter sandarakinus TaxID=2747268 RepID=A0ABX7I8J1_9BACT|nr:hypothetical protein [Dyadobacter sandarakinus]QRR02431.1 hypothetical protein HWI92_16690 [Dyadobacter sandarakinus]
MNLKNLANAFLLPVCLMGCSDDKAERKPLCTENLNAIVVAVAGSPLTGFYTVRLATSDTIRPVRNALTGNNYLVLDDSFRAVIAGQQEQFQFTGIRGDSMIRETYVIRADECHVYKVSGRASL